jgi:glycogen(starch) synthase
MRVTAVLASSSPGNMCTKNDLIDLPRRILMTADAIGGVWTYALDLASALKPYGVEIFLATMGKMPTEKQRQDARNIHNLRLFKSNYKLEWMENCWRDVEKAGHWLLHLEQRIKPDLIHLNGYTHASLPFVSPKVVVAHSCVLSWWKAVKEDPPPHRLAEYRKKVADGIAAADLVITPTQHMLDDVCSTYVTPRRKMVIHNGRDVDGFAPREKLNIILTAGRIWDEAKNIASIGRLPHDLARSVFIAGDMDGPDGDEVKRYANGNLIGKLSPKLLAQWMSRASIFALPALYEPFGLSILEAGLSGCALVLGDIASLRELWGDAAIFVDPRDDRALQVALRTLMSNRDVCRQMGERARARALEFTSERMAERYVSAYTSVAASRAAEHPREVIACA